MKTVFCVCHAEPCWKKIMYSVASVTLVGYKTYSDVSPVRLLSNELSQIIEIKRFLIHLISI